MVNKELSSAGNVRIKNISLNVAFYSFTCEVTAEAPKFLIDTKNMKLRVFGKFILN